LKISTSLSIVYKNGKWLLIELNSLLISDICSLICSVKNGGEFIWGQINRIFFNQNSLQLFQDWNGGN